MLEIPTAVSSQDVTWRAHTFCLVEKEREKKRDADSNHVCYQINGNWCWLITIDWRFLSRLYPSIHAVSFPCLEFHSLSSSSSLSRPEHLRALRDRESRPSKPNTLPRDICWGVQTIRFLGASSATARFISPSLDSQDCFLVHARCLLPWIVFFWYTPRITGSKHLLPGGRLRDCTANIFLHRLWSTTSSNTLCWLVRMESSVPSALVSPLSIFLNCYILFSVCLQSYLQYLSLVWVAIKLHTCTYMPPPVAEDSVGQGMALAIPCFCPADHQPLWTLSSELAIWDEKGKKLHEEEDRRQRNVYGPLVFLLMDPPYSPTPALFWMVVTSARVDWVSDGLTSAVESATRHLLGFVSPLFDLILCFSLTDSK